MNPANLSQEQIRQFAALTAGHGLNNNLLRLLGNNLNLINPMALQNLLNPLIANSMANANNINQNDSASGLEPQPTRQQQNISLPPNPAPQHHHQQQQQEQHQQQQLITQELFTQRLQQQLQQIVQSQRQVQPQTSFANNSGGTTLPNRQPQTMQNSAPPMMAGQQRRRRGRPPLSTPGTSAGTSTGPSAGAPVDYNYLNVLAALKNQQDRERMQRESRIQQDRQREILQQQERERQRELRIAQERQREIRLQQEREIQRIEVERQRKAQHRLALQEIERERRRQHMIMLKNLEAYKRNEEREKSMEALAVEKTKQMERRMHQKRLENELTKDIRKPIDDMMLKNHKPLAILNRIPGLKLPAKAFADLLMSYEFLYNFADTVGYDQRHIPDINTLQQGLLNLNTWAEDQLISILHHLCMFAIRDPRFPYTGSTKDVENLERTNEGLSQLLHFYLEVILNAKTEMEHESRLYKLIEQKYFLSLNATQKAEMFAFICNELLCSQTIAKQMEDTIENVSKLRKDKWVIENELRKYRVIKTKREFKEAEQKAKEEKEAEEAKAAATANGSDANNDEKPELDVKEGVRTRLKKEEEENGDTKPNMTNGSNLENTTLDQDNETLTQPNNTTDLEDLEPEMTNDELNKKLDLLTRNYTKTSNKLERAINSMRANPLGQDRYRRRYWVLPQVGGVFVEGMESSEPEEMENNKFTEEELAEYEKEMQELNAIAKAEQEEPANEGGAEEADKADDIKEQADEDDIAEKPEHDANGDDEAMEIKENEADQIKDETKMEIVENGEVQADVENADAFEEQEREQEQEAPVPTIPWFNILPRETCDFTYKHSSTNQESQDSESNNNKSSVIDNPMDAKEELTFEDLKAMRHEICPALAKRLEELEAEQYQHPRKIHPQFQYGWWRVTDTQQLKSILSVLHERGTRERILHKHLTKHFQYASNSCRNGSVDFEITSYDRQLAGKNYGAPVPHTDDDSADDLKEGEDDQEEELEGEEMDDDVVDDKGAQQASVQPAKKSKRKKGTRSARSRRLRARAAAKKKVENTRNRLATQR